MMRPLAGKIALVAGATRGAGRGIARMLGEAGATVYCSGRSTRGKPRRRRRGASPFLLRHRQETIEETAELVDGAGGKGIPVCVDHLVEAEVKGLVNRLRKEQGRLDILVNDVWGGDELTDWNKPFWEHSLSDGLLMQQRAVHSHIITGKYAMPLMLKGKGGLIVEITDGDSQVYRGNFYYDLAKISVIRLAFAMAEELRPHGIAAVALTPGFLRSEAMLEHFQVTEENWREGAKTDPHFIASETPFFVGRAVVALAADREILRKSGGAYSSWALAEEYGFTDMNGEVPNWGKYMEDNLQP